jgi:SAM-dependent methyltransferase
MPVPVPASESRPLALLREQYAVERELGDRLRAAPAAARRELYGAVYDEFLRRVPHQPVATRKADVEAREALVGLQSLLLAPYLGAETVYLEVGSGDSSLALRLAGAVRQVVAVEASAEIVAGLALPDGFRLIVANAPPYPLEAGSVDVAFSCHFIEHLHPEDAAAHVAEMRRLLRDGGRYVCVTPNRLYGPHDVSKYFDDEARGLHLKEYTFSELARLLRDAGFSRVVALRGVGVPSRESSLWPHRLIEAVAGRLRPAARRRWLARLARRPLPEPLRPLEQVKVVATR